MIDCMMVKPMDDTATQTSTTLLNRVAEGGDEQACRLFVERYGPLVRALAGSARLLSQDADEVEQEAMMAAVQGLRLHRYDREQGRFKLWFKGIVYHKIQKLRAASAAEGLTIHPAAPTGDHGQTSDQPTQSKAPSRGLRIETNLDEFPDPAPQPDERFDAEFERRWQEVRLEEALDEIRREVEPTTYQAFDLYARKNMPVGQVAKLLGLSRNAVYIAKTRVSARLHDRLADA